MQKPHPLATGLAFLFLALLLAGLAARFWASDKAYGFTGPTHIAAGEQHVYLFASGDIYRLTHAGELLSVTAPDLSGLKDHPIDLRVTPDGQLLIAEQRPATIRLCDVDSWNCRPIGAAADSVIERQFKVLQGTAPDELLLTDARGDTLWRLSGVGGEPQKLLEEGTLDGPNDMVFDAGGNLWVADTDHRKIVELSPSGNGAYQVGRQHSAMNPLTIGERFFPMMLAGTADGRLWVTQAAEFSKPYADLLVYDPEDGVKALIDLPDGAYATDIVALDDSVLVTDLERFTVYQVQAGTLELGEFGDERFQRRLGQIRESREYYDRLGERSMAAVILMAVLMISAAIWATPKARRWTQPPAPFNLSTAPGEVPRTNGIHWLERDPKIDRSLKWMEHLGFFLFITMIAGGLVLYAWVRSQAGPDAVEDVLSRIDELGIIMLLSGILLSLTIPLVRFSLHAMKRKLGTDGKRIYILLEDGRELSADPSQLAYTNRQILYRKYTLPLLGGKQKPLYAPGEVETWLAPLLRQSRKLTEIQALKYQWKNRF
jgi:sugar lactone lactonase YvrE